MKTSNEIEERLIEVTSAADRYEEALAHGDIAVLKRLFVNSDRTTRFGDDEELWGEHEIAAYRRRHSEPVVRTVTRRQIDLLSESVAHVGLTASYPDGHKIRQTQVWVRQDNGVWRVAHAHVSWPYSRGVGATA